MSEPHDVSSPAGSIAVLNRDLFFGVRIANGLRALGYTVDLVTMSAVYAERLRATPTPVLAVVDLTADPDWPVITEATDRASIPILAFGPHTDVASRRAAQAAGVTRLVSNGEFHRAMPDLVARYARPVGPEEPATPDQTDTVETGAADSPPIQAEEIDR
jgi:hypothetical protein